jgi:hypothetical protein
MIARNDPPNSLQMLVLVLERRSRDSCDQCRQVTPSGSLRCDRCGAIVTVDRYSGSLRRFICGGLSWRACQKNYSINAGEIGINNTQGCCFNLSRHKAIERLVVDLKLSRLGSYNRWGFPFVCHFQDSMHLL